MVDVKRKRVRTCIACREAVEQDELIRYVVAPDGALLVDYRHKLPGRGTYTCLKKDCIMQAVQRKAFGRSLKNAQVDVDIDLLLAAIKEQVTNRVLSLIGMARKAGLVASGSQLVLSSLQNPRDIAWVLLATDVSQGVGSKVRQRVKNSANRSEILLLEYFDKATLGTALGLSERSVVALMKSPLAQTLNKELQRYKYVMGEL